MLLNTRANQNMKNWENFNNYYKIWFIAGFLIFGVRFALDVTTPTTYTSKNIAESIVVVIILSSMIGISCGGIYHWFYEVYRPKKNKKLFQLIEHWDFSKQNIFRKENENHFAGYFQNYYTYLFPDIGTDGKKYIIIQQFVKISDENVSNSKEILKQFEIIQDVSGLNRAETKFQFDSKKLPNEIEVIEKIEQAIKILKVLNLDAEKIT